MSITLLDVLKPALRRGGITILPGTTPSTDQTTELIAEVNRMLGAWNCNGHLIYSTSIDEYTLVADQKIYTIGPGGEFNTARPIAITEADMIYPTDPEVRRPVYIADDDVWSRIGVQDIAGAPSSILYYDSTLNSSGQGKIYLWPQPSAGYKLELYTWKALQASFTATSDVVLFPPGYEDAIVKNLALCIVALYPEQSNLNKNPLAYSALQKAAGLALDTLITLNTESPNLRSEAAEIGGERQGSGMDYGWWLAPGA